MGFLILIVQIVSVLLFLKMLWVGFEWIVQDIQDSL